MATHLHRNYALYLGFIGGPHWPVGAQLRNPRTLRQQSSIASGGSAPVHLPFLPTTTTGSLTVTGTAWVSNLKTPPIPETPSTVVLLSRQILVVRFRHPGGPASSLTLGRWGVTVRPPHLEGRWPLLSVRVGSHLFPRSLCKVSRLIDQTQTWVIVSSR